MSENKKWVTMWGNAISIAERRPESYAKDITLRYPIKAMLDGSAVRITLDNFCGNEDVTITSACIARSAGGDRIAAETTVKLTFGGSRSVTVPAGGHVTCDSVEFDICRGEDITVSLYLGDFTKMRSGVLITGPLSGGFYAVGNRAESAELGLDTSRPTNWIYFLSDVEILTDKTKRTVVCYGDSITAQAWPDFLMKKVLEHDPDTAVIRKAASGTRILRQYDDITYESYGLMGKKRFPHEVFVSGADTVIIQHGINDIIHPVGVEVNPFRPWSDLPSSEELIEGLRWYIRTAKEQGVRVLLGTLLPIDGWRTYADFRETLRNEVNEWIRNNDEADGCIDFDKAVRDPNRPTAFSSENDSGDHLHPSLRAYEIMGNTAFDGIYKK